MLGVAHCRQIAAQKRVVVALISTERLKAFLLRFEIATLRLVVALLGLQLPAVRPLRFDLRPQLVVTRTVVRRLVYLYDSTHARILTRSCQSRVILT